MAWSHTLAAHAHKVHRRYEQKHTKPLRGSWLVFARFEQLCARRPRTLHRPVCMRRHGGTFQLLTPSMRIQTNPRSASETQPVAELASATVGPARTCAGVEPRRRQARLIRIGMLVLAASAHAMLHEWNGSMIRACAPERWGSFYLVRGAYVLQDIFKGVISFLRRAPT